MFLYKNSEDKKSMTVKIDKIKEGREEIRKKRREPLSIYNKRKRYVDTSALV